MKLFVEVELVKKWVLLRVWFCLSLYFKFLNVLDILGQFCCCGICHCFLMSIAFMVFFISQPSLPFLHDNPCFSYPLAFNKWKTIADFNRLFRNIKTSSGSYFGTGLKRFMTLIIFSPCITTWFEDFPRQNARHIPGSSLAVRFCHLCLFH